MVRVMVYWEWDAGTQTGQRAKERGAWVGKASIRATSQTKPSKTLVFFKTLFLSSWVHHGLQDHLLQKIFKNLF